MSSFVHSKDFQINTLSEIVRVSENIKPDRYFGCYAYATQSGFRAFELAVGPDFWEATSSRWLFGFDYGRSDARALREIGRRAQAEVRIFDGAWIVDREGFRPRRDFHAKVALMENTTAKMYGAVLGSGNFSYNGLRRSVEAGTSIVAQSAKAIDREIKPLSEAFEALWSTSTPLKDVIDKYEAKRAKITLEIDLKKPAAVAEAPSAFWIEAGYVTKNRGDDKPGNQIFFPRGFRTFFNLPTKKYEEKNSVLGAVTLITPVGSQVTNNLRLNRNSMEKMSLPVPESHGYGVYDGKILVFEPVNSKYRMSAWEATDFDTVFGHRIVSVQRMIGGRRYGVIV